MGLHVFILCCLTTLVFSLSTIICDWAGGVAQVAHLWFTGTMDPSIDPQPNPWKDLKNEVGLTVRTMSFEGPMTTVFMRSDDNELLNQKGIDFINKCSANMCTTCYSMDVVQCTGMWTLDYPRLKTPCLILLITKKASKEASRKTWWNTSCTQPRPILFGNQSMVH